MNVNILLFGIAKDIVGKQHLKIELEGSTSVSEFKKVLQEQYPELTELSSLAIAVNSEYATDAYLIHENDEVAIIPPVSGG